MGHGFDNEDAGHDGIAGPVSLKEWLIDGDVLNASDMAARFKGEDTVDEEEGEAVGENLHDFVDVQGRFRPRFGESLEGAALGIAVHERFFNLLPEFDVHRMAGLDTDYVTFDGAAEEEEVAEKIEDLVADELVGEAQLVVEDGFVADDDCVL